MLSYKKISLFICLLFFAAGKFYAQFAPQAGFYGTTAIAADSNIFVGWASGCVVHRGYINISDTNATYNGSNKASFGSDTNACGMPGGNMDVVSLGDGGYAILSFDKPVKDGEGYDFAVFENGFVKQPDTTKAFLELAFVAVSSDSIHFVRFPAVSLTSAQKQVGTFDGLDAVNIHNLAGKYIQGYGTPFDLAELSDSAFLDINNIKWIKITDAVGTIDSNFATYDSQGHIINDPFPTPFASCGFDLNAVGVIHQNDNFEKNQPDKKISLYPNPVKDRFFVISKDEIIQKIEIFTSTGQKIFSQTETTKYTEINLQLQKNLYFVKISTEKNIKTIKIIVID